ncbi:zf-DHHC-domain-containing protein [Xylariomycetidae sp. FL0641]|nr:zf-DHHC-domain-containing protein [Xylariomycetidae sp. FL0641]
MAFLVGSAPAIERLAIPASCLLMAFLGYGSQLLFATSPELEPGALTPGESRVFNGLLLCLWWTYYKACSVDPGRYVFPKSKSSSSPPDAQEEQEERAAAATTGGRWCRKCAAPKPPRAHHCKTCRRCVPRMDHHCPWTANCVSLQTFPHFLRFLLYANLSLWYLLSLLGARFLRLWAARHLPAYLGPTLGQLVWVTVFAGVGGVAALALGILLAVTVKGWAFNTTMIEGWEVERHEAQLARRPADEAAFLDPAAPRPDPVEFPYDVGIPANLAAAMGSPNPLVWLLPFAPGPEVNHDGSRRGAGWEYEENDLNDRPGLWPPPDPDRARSAALWARRRAELAARNAHDHQQQYPGPPGTRAAEDEKAAFRRRQERWGRTRQRLLGELEEVADFDDHDDDDDESERGGAEEEGYAAAASAAAMHHARPRYGVATEGRWTNAEGEQLGDFGVDEEAEADDGLAPASAAAAAAMEDEDVPLAELIRRRKVRTKDGEDT